MSDTSWTLKDTAVGQLGVNFNTMYLSADNLPHAQGTIVDTQNGKVILVQAQSAIPQYALCVYGPSSAAAAQSVDAYPASLTNVSARLFAVAQTSIAKSAYGWLHIDCHTGGRVNSAVAEMGVIPYLTATGGTIDDAATSGKALANLWIQESATSASAPRAIWRGITLDRDQLA
jgi:hypothetical protein